MDAHNLKIGLIDCDLLSNGTRHPNLALMKISAYCKSISKSKLIFSEEELSNLNDFDIIIMSKVFTFSKISDEIKNILDSTNKSYSDLNVNIIDLFDKYKYFKPRKTAVAIGGTGFFMDGGNNLPDIIEHIMPDYSLYDEFVQHMIKNGRNPVYYNDYLNYSIGFATRGCFRKCDFCVNKKYDRCNFHAHVKEFVNNQRNGIYLWDDNIFAFSGWELVFRELEEIKKPFQFRQGLDIRLLSEKKAAVVSKSKYDGDVIFAFDHVDDFDLIDNKLSLWRKYSKKPTKLYVLCAFDSWEYSNLNTNTVGSDKKHLLRIKKSDTQDQRDIIDIEGVFIRIQLLMKHGCMPYIMRFEKYKLSKYRGMYVQLARWCNQPQFYKKMSFREFCIANQNYAKTDVPCAPMRALTLFENDAPNIAAKYFDMKYEDVHAIY